MKTNVILVVTLTISCVLLQTIRAATIDRSGSKDGLTREQIQQLLDLPLDGEYSRLYGDKRASPCSSFTGCMQMRIAEERVASMLRSGDAHLFGELGAGKRRRSVDDAAQAALAADSE